jgi:hypothetical protein
MIKVDLEGEPEEAKVRSKYKNITGKRWLGKEKHENIK